MGVNRTPSGRDPAGTGTGAGATGSGDTAHAAGEVIELLELLWERGRNAVPSGPVSPSQLRVMYYLDREEGINLRTLGEALGAASSSVSRLCDRLEAVGFVRRAPSATSRRELELHLTSQGRRHLRQLRVQREEALLAVLADMRPREREALLKGLNGFRAAAERADPYSRAHPPIGGGAARPA